MTQSPSVRWVRAARTNLRRRVSRSPVAFAMSGGGSQGSFETGALRFLYDDLGVRPAILCGSSVGSIIAGKLAEGDDAVTGRRAIDEIEDVWRGLRSNNDMWLAEPWLEKLRSQANWASELRGRAAENGTAGSQARVVLRMLSEVVRHPPETDGTLDALRQAMRARSLLSMQPVRELVEGNIDADRVAASGLVLRVGAVGLESGELRYITERGEVQTPRRRPARPAPGRADRGDPRVRVNPVGLPADPAQRRALRRRGSAGDPPVGAGVQPARRGPHLRGGRVDARRRSYARHRRQGPARARTSRHRGHRPGRDAAQRDQPAARLGQAGHRHRTRARRARRARRWTRCSSPRRSTTATCARPTCC